MTRTAVLVDFGGVLTTSVLDALRSFGSRIGVDPGLPLTLLATDPILGPAFADFESGRLDDEVFERLLARRLTECGADVHASGLLARLRSDIRPAPDMLELVGGIRAAGHKVALVSNSLGRDCYDDVDLADLVDTAVISAEVGLRKPAREIYRLACRRLGVEPGRAVMIDDLAHNIAGAARCGIPGIVHGSATRTAEELATRFGVFPLLPPTTIAPTGWRRSGTRKWLR